jgi:biotin carboxylase
LEFIVTAGGVRLIEVAARGCGARVVTDLLPAMSGIVVIGARLRQAVGAPVTLPPAATQRHGILRFIELPAGRIAHIGGRAEAEALEDVVLVHLQRAPGDEIAPAQNGDGRPGFVMATGASRAGVIATAERAIRTLAIDIAPLVIAVPA